MDMLGILYILIAPGFWIIHNEQQVLIACTVGAIIIWSLADFVGSLTKNGTVYNFNHRYILTLRDRISQKNPE